jgi:transcriptional regulator with XRE-family HTH domain
MAKAIEQLIAREKPEVVAKAKERAAEIILDIRLADLRERAQKTQEEIASVLGVRQPTVSDMEQPGHDIKLSSLKRYVEASGGKLRIDVELSDGSHVRFQL